VIGDSDGALKIGAVSRSEWNSLLSGFRDSTVFQTWEYGVCTWGEGNLSHAVLKRGEQTLAAAQIRVWNRVPGLKFASVVHGPLWRVNGCPDDTGALVLMLRALVREYEQKRGYSLRLIPFVHEGDPLADKVKSILQEHQFAMSRDRGTTLVLDISVPEEVLRANMRRKWRQELGYAERARLDVTYDNSPERFAECLAVYREMHGRKNFRETTQMDAFLSIHALLPESQRFNIVTVGHEGRLHACVIGTAIGDTAFPVLAATATCGLKSNASYLAYWELLKLYQRAGIRWFDFRGVDRSGNPGGYVFKTGISGKGGLEVAYLGEFVRFRSDVAKLLLATGEKARVWLRLKVLPISDVSETGRVS